MVREKLAAFILIFVLFICVPQAVVYALSGEVREGTNQPFNTAPKEMPGVALARTVSESTGLAISPLLTAGLWGAYNYFSAAPTQRNNLPWHSSLYFWVTTLAVGLLFAVNGLIGSWIPFLSKPMNAVETIEHKVTALFVGAPIIASKIGGDLTGVISQPLLSSFYQKQDIVMAGVSFEGSTILLYIVGFIFITVAFFVVWLFSQTINTLILLSPFPPIDWLMNIFKYGVLALILISSLINPYLGLAVSLVIILFCWYISAWCFRFMVFGTVFAWDILTIKHKRISDNDRKIKAFTSCILSGVPKRSYGNLSKNNLGGLVFTYRPWLIFSQRSVTPSFSDYIIEKGLLYPSVVLEIEEKGRYEKIFTLPPHYKTHEKYLCETLGTINILESKSIRGFKSAFQWFKDIFSKDVADLSSRKADVAL